MREARRFIAIAAAIAIVALSATAAAAVPTPGTPIVPPPGVPAEGRAWELVTSPETISTAMYLFKGLALTGDRAVYQTIGPLPGAPFDTPVFAPALAVRGGDGWVNSTPRIPRPGGLAFFANVSALAYAPDMTSSIWMNEIPAVGEGGSADLGYYRQGPGGDFSMLGEVGSGASFAGSSTDLEHVVFSSSKHLLPADATRTEGGSIYEFVGSALRLVDLDNSGKLLSDCGSSVPAGGISGDGSRIFFSTHPGCAGPARIYLREHGDTTEISASHCTLPNCGPEADVTFVGATPSASSAFLVAEQKLTDEDTDEYPDLYRYDVAGDELSLVSGSGWPELLPSTETLNVSADGSRVYFSATELTAPEEAAGSHSYVADAAGVRSFTGAGSADRLQISRDGRYAVFATAASLVPGDSDESVDVYRYDAQSGALAEISVGPEGRGNGVSDIELGPYSSALVASHPFRVISEDGRRVFFSSDEQLLPQDSNEVRDVYEWADGRLGLISSGVDPRPSHFLGATPDGRSALFMTSATLVPSDRDGGDLDLYLARIGGGFAESATVASCSGAACRTTAPPPLNRPTPASARGAGGIRIQRLGPDARRRIAASGTIVVLVEAPGPGRLSASARARVGQGARTIAATDREVAQAGPLRLRMPLAQSARDRLAAGHDLRVRLRVRLTGLGARSIDFRLKAPQ